jgi:hypothetical protein
MHGIADDQGGVATHDQQKVWILGAHGLADDSKIPRVEGHGYRLTSRLVDRRRCSNAFGNAHRCCVGHRAKAEEVHQQNIDLGMC